MTALWRLTFALLSLASTSTAFVAPSHSRRPWTSSSWRPWTSSSWRMSSSDDDEAARNRIRTDIRTDIRNLLTQRAIQSFVYLLMSLRDPHTVRWLENTYEFKSLEHYHGTGAFNLTKFDKWDSILRDMLSRPSDVVIVSAKGRRYDGGWRGHYGKRKTNPYFKERYVDFEIEIEIDPPSLVSRIVSIRDQIAKEWRIDLDTFIKANEMILESYHKKELTDRTDEECVDFDDPEDGIDTEQLIAPYSDPNSNVYDRNAMYLLDNTMGSSGASSPNRKGNFDLMVLLATQESVHRVLREYRKIGDEREVSFEWLRQFYLDRIPTFFDGNQEYHRADDFMEELLTTTPSMKDMDGKVGLIDPMRIAEDIIAMRTRVAKDWKKVMKAVPKDHMELQRELLAVRMGKYNKKDEDKEEEEEEEKPTTASKEAKPADTEVGSFE